MYYSVSPDGYTYLMKYAMYVYGALTAPNPDNIPIIVTPITPTLLIGCSIEKIPTNQ